MEGPEHPAPPTPLSQAATTQRGASFDPLHLSEGQATATRQGDAVTFTGAPVAITNIATASTVLTAPGPGSLSGAAVTTGAAPRGWC